MNTVEPNFKFVVQYWEEGHLPNLADEARSIIISLLSFGGQGAGMSLSKGKAAREERDSIDPWVWGAAFGRDIIGSNRSLCGLKTSISERSS